MEYVNSIECTYCIVSCQESQLSLFNLHFLPFCCDLLLCALFMYAKLLFLSQGYILLFSYVKIKTFNYTENATQFVNFGLSYHFNIRIYFVYLQDDIGPTLDFSNSFQQSVFQINVNGLYLCTYILFRSLRTDKQTTIEPNQCNVQQF